jgi:hypothetical protein
MKIIAYLKSTMRLATSLFLSVFALAVVFGLGTAGYYQWQKTQAKEYETAKTWTSDLNSILQFSLNARTKMVDGQLYIIVTTDSLPPYMKYQLTAARQDESKGFYLNFVDKDGFKVFSKSIPLNKMASIVDATGKAVGLNFEADEYLDVTKYASFSKLDVQWNLNTELPPAAAPAVAAAEAGLDHCAPKLTKEERLKRLSTNGKLRQSGDGTYSVGHRSVVFSTYDNSLVYCN